MAEAKAVLIPLLNPNEPEATLVMLYVAESQRVAAGDPVCVIENTKSAAEIVAESEGFIVGLRASPGEILRAGNRLCWVADSADWGPPEGVRGGCLWPTRRSIRAPWSCTAEAGMASL